MLRSEPRPDPAVLDELERLDAALHGAPATSAEDVELAALVADVRSTRPVLDAEARGRLAKRAEESRGARAARRPGPTKARRAAASRRWRLGLAAAAAVATVAVAVPVGMGVLGGGGEVLSMDVSSGGDAVPNSGASDETSVSGSSSPTPETAAGGTSSSSGTSATSSAPSGSAPTTLSPTSSRRVIRDVTQTLRVGRHDVAAAAARVSTVVDDEGGYLASSTVRERGSSAGGSFSVVVPTGRLDATVAALSRIGRPVRLERSSSDVTDRATSLQDRLDDLRAERSAARLALARTVDADRRAARRRELRVLSSRVAGATADRDALRRRTSTATIALRLTTREPAGDPAPVADDGSWGIGDAWQDARRVLGTTAGVALLAGVVLLPFALLAGLAVTVRRRASAAARNRLVDAS